MAVNAMHAFGYMNIAILGWDNTMFVVRPTTCRRMTPETHLVGGFLDILCSLQYIYATCAPELQGFTLFHHPSPIISVHPETLTP
jgi:hypothetical protein